MHTKCTIQRAGNPTTVIVHMHVYTTNRMLHSDPKCPVLCVSRQNPYGMIPPPTVSEYLAEPPAYFCFYFFTTLQHEISSSFLHKHPPSRLHFSTCPAHYFTRPFRRESQIDRRHINERRITNNRPQLHDPHPPKYDIRAFFRHPPLPLLHLPEVVGKGQLTEDVDTKRLNICCGQNKTPTPSGAHLLRLYTYPRSSGKATISEKMGA